MSGILCSFVGATYASLPAYGESYEGGFFAGQISDGGTVYNLVVAPLATGQSSEQYRTSNGSSTGAESLTDGPANTTWLNSPGDGVARPAAEFCAALTIGGYSDWYMPAKHELEICYRNLKPTTDSNTGINSSGVNPASIPAGTQYTSGNPAQTSATDFQSGNTEAFSASLYHSSSATSVYDWSQRFNNGEQRLNNGVDETQPVRAIRRVAA